MSRAVRPTNAPALLCRPGAIACLLACGKRGARHHVGIEGRVEILHIDTDLHLLAGSMCIDAGTTTGAPAYDMDGAARTGTPPDIGPDER